MSKMLVVMTRCRGLVTANAVVVRLVQSKSVIVQASFIKATNSPSVIVPQPHISKLSVAESKHLRQRQCDIVEHNADAHADNSKQRHQPEEEGIIGAEQEIILGELQE